MVKAAATLDTFAVEPARGVKRLAAALALAMAGTFAVTAWAQPVPGGPGGPGGPGLHRMHRMPDGDLLGPGLFFGRPEHVDRAVDRLLKDLNATEAQRSQIQQIARAAAQDLHALHEAARGQHEQGWALFTAPVVDARAVETLRQQRLAQHDQASKRMTQALVEVSNVLSPDQRAKLAERFKQREARMQQRLKDHPRRGAASAPAK